ncbi:hypothetical protein NVV95_18185 [Herbiconiux sp. CPCC 205716]|uniref:ABC transporter permease n=1 Tax=Herbiconiux gentiana TaxID=2970912 RepID=A0ABT2GJT4_9MICO|nr:hypothetical protein [Herbiconiux gentiana]MCS5716480.1 hypothetical protein [Herbiconiux gentiana]
MSTVETPTRPAPAAKAAGGGRIVAIARLHLVNRWQVFAIPAMILLFILLVNIVIWWLIVRAVTDPADLADTREGLQYSGASFYIFVYAIVLGAQGVAYVFPYALGMSVTRRDFWLGSLLAFVALSAVYSAFITVLATVETATDGWGLGGRMFTVLYFGGEDAPWYQRFLLFFAAFLFCFLVGSVVATIYQRWRVNGMIVFFAALTLVVLGAVATITLSESWGLVGAWFVETGPGGLVAWSLVVTVLSAVVGYLLIRRSTPRG